jgi:hypothetical protein
MIASNKEGGSMIRYRYVAVTPGAKHYTVDLVRFLTDDQALEQVNLPKARAMYKDTLSVEVYREACDRAGRTVSRERVVLQERFVFDYETRVRPLGEDRLPRRGRITVMGEDYRDAFMVAFEMLYGRRDVDQVTALDLVL